MAGSSETPCYYAVLGVARGATAAEIRAAYRRKALKLDPDKVQLQGDDSGATKEAQAAMFHLLREAYQVLSDASRRAVYDADVLCREADVLCRQAESDLRRTFESMDNLIEHMKQTREGTRQFVNELIQRSILAMDDELRTRIEEITKGNLPRTPGRAGPQKHNASSSSPTSASCSNAHYWKHDL